MPKYLDENGLSTLWGKITDKISNKQDKLVSGNNLKTINGNSLLGSGNLVITGLPEIGYYSGTASESVNINAPNDEYSMQIGTYGLTLDNGTPADAPDNVFTVNSNTLTWNGYNIPYVQLSSSSYLILAGSNGVRKLQICKGTISKKNSSSTATVTLPQSMPNTDYYILLQTATSYQTVMSRITSKKTSSFTVDNISGGASGGTTIWYYVAIYIQ